MAGLVRVYGPRRGNSSWPRVCSGVCAGLSTCNELAGFFDIAQVDGMLDDPCDEAGSEAAVGLCVGPPLSAGVMTGRGQHRQKLSMVAANSSWLPRAMMDYLCECTTALVAPSIWACDVLQRHAIGHPIKLYHHGLDADFRRLDDVKATGPFSVLHLASTHRQRKGTRKLILAWAQARLPEGSVLNVVADGPRGFFDEALAECGNPESVHVRARLDLTVQEMAAVYQQHHFICQPSRAEGFGLVPLEARGCGVPVIATICTGHADHMDEDSPGVVVIEHGDEGAIDDGPGAQAPTISVEAIADALVRANDDLALYTIAARKHAEELHHVWSWEAVTRSFVELC